ncbi:hypothetical protein DBL04_02130 [Acinetobacter seifertii]|nr:hypothetical protein DBL04_02130 [Acinetobacter seifertii]
MCKANSLYMEFCQSIKFMVAERKRVRRLVKTSSTPEGVPLPSYRYGRRLGVFAQNYSSEEIILMRS